MSKLLVILSLALLLSVAFGTATPVAGTASFTSSAFVNATELVFSVVNSTDKVSEWMQGSIPTSGVIFGPGADNTTVWAYGVTYSSTLITGIVQRKVLTSTLTSGNDTAGAELSVSGADAVATGLTLPSIRTPVFAVGNGYLAAAVVSSTGTSGTTVQALNLLVWTAGSTTAASTAIVTSAADVNSGTAPVSTTDYNVGNVWYQDGYFYVTYSVVAGTASVPASGTTINVWTENAVYLQAIGASNASKLYTTGPVAVVSSLTATISSYSRTAPTTAIYPIGGPSNYTLPSYVYVLYKASGKIMGIPVNRTAGTAGTANTLTTDATVGTSAAGMTYFPTGVWYTTTFYGALISNQTQANSAATTYSYALASCNVTTCADSGLGVLSAAATGSTNMVYGWSYPFNSTGYGLIAYYTTATSGVMGLTEQTFNSTGSATQSSVVSVGTVQGVANIFMDSVHSLWLGYAISDTANSGFVYSGYIGRVVYNLLSGSSSGNVLASFFAFLTLLLASLFAF